MTLPTPNLAAWRTAIIAFNAVVTGGAALWLSLRPSRPASRLGMRGLKRQRALLNPFWGSVEPLVRWMGVRVSGILAETTRNKLDRHLTHAGDFLGLTVDEYFALFILGGIVGGLAGAVAVTSGKPGFFLPVALGVGAAMPHVVVDAARARRYLEMNRGLPYAIDLMSLSMSAGLDFPGAVQQVVKRAKVNESLRDELGYLLQQFHLGRTRSQALTELSDRVPIETVREFCHALLQAEQRGSPVAAVLEIQASTARIRRSNQAENAAQDMQSKMVIPASLLLALSMAVVLIPGAMMTDKMIESFSTTSQPGTP